MECTPGRTQADTLVAAHVTSASTGSPAAGGQTAMLAEMPYQKLRDTVITHLTTAEGLGFLLGNVPPR